jgi:hypothetical protein
MDSQKGVLAQLARIVRVPDHAVDDVPAEPLMVAYQRFEGAARARQDGGHEHAIGVEGLRLAHLQAVGFDGHWFPSTHPVMDTPAGSSVASPA